MYNPWQVDSIQAFSILKCPECFFDTKDENKFEDHAVANHPMSYVLFGKSEKDINHSSVTVQASKFDKEGTEKYLQEENDIDIKEEPIEDLIVEPLLDKDSTFSVKEDGNWNKETFSLKHPPSYELLKKMSDKKQKFAVKVVKCSSCDFVTNCKHLKFKHCELLDKEINHGDLNPVKVKLQEIGEESKEKSVVEKELLKESPVIDEDVCDDNFVEVGKIKKEPSENIVVESTTENLDEQNPIEVSKVEKEVLKESVQINKEVIYRHKEFCDDNIVEVGKIKEEPTEKIVVETLDEQRPIEVFNENKSHLIDNLPFKCSECDFSSNTLKRTTIHMKKHSRLKKEVQCNICGLSFPKTTLQRHIDEVHNRVHEEIHNYQCRLCDYGSDYEDGLKSHLKLFHKIEESKTELDKYRTGQTANEIKEREERITKKQEFIKCDQCELTIYPTKNMKIFKSLNRHIASVHNQESKTELDKYQTVKAAKEKKQPQRIPKKEELIKCDKCEFYSATKISLNRHIATAHIQEQPPFLCFDCEICGNSYQSKQGLEDHMLTSHHCSSCSKSFDDFTQLQTHLYSSCFYRQRNPKIAKILANQNEPDYLKKPKMSYEKLIMEALTKVPEGKLTSTDIYETISLSYPYYEMENKDWKNQIRHCLTINDNFIKLSQDKGSYWTLKESLTEPDLEPSSEMDPLSNDHLASEHGSVPLKIDKKLHSCHLCSYKHEKEIFLKIHLESHFRWNPISKKRKFYLGYKDSQSNSNLSCKQCEFVCEFKTSLKRHTLTFHGNRKYFDSAFKCEICGNGYKSNEGLKTHFSYEHEETQSKKLRSKLEKESSPKVISAESDKKQDLQKIEEENIEIWDFENTVDNSVQKEPNVPNNLPAAQSASIPENQPKKRNRKQTMAERQTF